MLPAFVIHQSLTLKKRLAFLKAKIRRNYYALTKDTPVQWSMETSLENEIFCVKKGVKSGDTVFQIPPKFRDPDLNSDRTYILFQFFENFFRKYATENKIHYCTDFCGTKIHITY